MDLQELVEQYNRLIEKYGYNRKEKISQVFEFYGDRFFTAPASAKVDYHCCFEGGLAVHSMNVLKRLFQVAKAFVPERFDDPEFTESLLIIGMFHDLGKIGTHPLDGGVSMFEPQTDKWRAEKMGQPYQYGNLNDGLEHAERSVQLLLREGFPLTQEEIGAIRFHDGAYLDTNRTVQVKYMKNSLKDLAHYADHWSSWNDEK